MPDDKPSPATVDDPRDGSENPPLPAHLAEVELPTENVVDIDLNLGSAAAHADESPAVEDDEDEDEDDEQDVDVDEDDVDEVDAVETTNDTAVDQPA